MHIAVLTKQSEIAGELLSHGADINAEDDRGCTYLRLAIEETGIEVQARRSPALSLQVASHDDKTSEAGFAMPDIC